MRIGHAVVKAEEEAKDVYYHNLLDQDFRHLAKTSSGRWLLGNEGLLRLHKVQPIQEVRIVCTKPYHKRTLDIKTNKNELGR